MKNKLEQLKNLWSVKNYQLIIIMTLVVVVLLQAFPIELPTSVEAYEKQEMTLEAIIDERAIVIQEGMFKEAKYRAMREVYDELGIMVEIEFQSFE